VHLQNDDQVTRQVIGSRLCQKGRPREALASGWTL